jgi:hypothetical protein
MSSFAAPDDGGATRLTMESTWDRDDMAKVAVHEVGHAIVRWLFGLSFHSIRLDVENQGGGVDVDVEDTDDTANLCLAQRIALEYGGPLAEKIFGGPANRWTSRRALIDHAKVHALLVENGTPEEEPEGQALQIRGYISAEQILRKHEDKIRRVAKQLQQSPYEITREEFEQMMQEEDC